MGGPDRQQVSLVRLLRASAPLKLGRKQTEETPRHGVGERGNGSAEQAGPCTKAETGEQANRAQKPKYVKDSGSKAWQQANGTQGEESEGDDGEDSQGGYMLAGPGLGGGEDEGAEDWTASAEYVKGEEAEARSGHNSEKGSGEGKGGPHPGRGVPGSRAHVVVARGTEAGQVLKQQGAAGRDKLVGGGSTWGSLEVPTWDGELGLPATVPAKGLLLPAKKKAARYDEWDEELDRGRVKKVKKKEPWSSWEVQGNPFQTQAADLAHKGGRKEKEKRNKKSKAM